MRRVTRLRSLPARSWLYQTRFRGGPRLRLTAPVLQLVIERATRNKRKCVTTVIGLDMFGVKLAEASKKFGKKFACGASVTKDASNKEQIDVQARAPRHATRRAREHPPDAFATAQGDFMDEIAEFICKEWSEVRAAGRPARLSSPACRVTRSPRVCRSRWMISSWLTERRSEDAMQRGRNWV